MSTCKQCNNEFKPRSTGNVYCSRECLNNSRWKPEPRKCENLLCSASFMTTRTHQDKKYCSRSCSATVNNSTKPKRVSAYSYSNCKVCSEKFKTSKSKTTYCSLTCHNNDRRDIATKLWLTTGQAILASDPNHYVRSYIRDAQKGCCAVCSMQAIWNGKEIRFILDHIDGNSQNNHRDNLRLVCPNCDSQLDTYKAKNKGKGRHNRRIRYANGQSY
jgi:hypothetical protein